MRDESKRWPVVILVAIVAATTACGTAGPAVGPQAETTGGGSATPSTLVLLPPNELASLNPLPLFRQGGSTQDQFRLFNAGLTLLDGNGNSRPYLAEALPELGTGSWTVSADGKMETLFRLRADAIWHDGVPLRSSDFVFAWRLISDRSLGISGLPPQGTIADIVAPDDLTVRIRWSGPFPDAAKLDGWGRGLMLVPLPEHVLSGPSEQGLDTLRNNSFWTVDYVGAGPFKLDRWQQGAFIEGRAFAGHVLGRPKIERIKLLFVPDSNGALANLLAGEAHGSIDAFLHFPEGLVLRDRWAAEGVGQVALLPSTLHWVQIQHRPEYANPRAVTDLRVRQALAHAMNKSGMNDELYGSLAMPADTFIMPTMSYFSIVERAITRYPYDPRRSEQLMNEAGFARDREGVYTDGTNRLNFEYLSSDSSDIVGERTVMSSGWRQAGFPVEEGLTPRGNLEAAATFRSMSSGAGFAGLEGGMSRFTSGTISSAQTRWVGENVGGWSNPDYDRAVLGVQTTLDRDQRYRHLAEAARAMSEDLGVIFMQYSPIVYALSSKVRGGTVDVRWGTNFVWNVYEWEMS